MNGRELLSSYDETIAHMEPASAEQLTEVEGFVNRYLEGAEVEPLGDNLASWRLVNGIQVNVRVTQNPNIVEEETDRLNYSTSTYDVHFRRYLDVDKPEAEQRQYVELSYSFLVPEPDSLAYGSIDRTCTVVDLGKTYLGSPSHALMSHAEFAQKYNESVEEAIFAVLDGGDTPTKADLAMISAILVQTTSYKGDPLALLGAGKLHGPEANFADIRQLAPQIEATAAQGFVSRSRSSTIDVPVDTPDYSASLFVSKDESAHGPLTNLAHLRDFSAWMIQLTLQQADTPVREVVRLSKRLNGVVKSERYPVLFPGEFYRLSQEDTDDFTRYRDAHLVRQQAKAVRETLGLVAATAAEVQWFQDLTSNL